MSFSFSAGGTREQAVGSLQGLDFSQAYSDKLGAEIRDLLVEKLGDSDGNPDLRYDVSAYGHAGQGSILSLNVAVTGRWLSNEELAARDALAQQQVKQAQAAAPAPVEAPPAEAPPTS